MITMRWKVTNNVPLVVAAVKEATDKQLIMIAGKIVRVAQTSMKSGGSVRLGNKVISGIPSTPPDPPNVQTGNLKNSITHAVVRHGLGGYISVVVGPSMLAMYGRIHELGLGRYPVRAFMIPALVEVINNLPALFKKIDLSQTTAGRAANMKELYEGYGRVAP